MSIEHIDRMHQIIATVRGFEGALVVEPGPESDAPELAWGDSFFYFAPDARMPEHTQPYGTIVTKDYPDDTASELDRTHRWRVNIHVDRATFRELTGEDPRRLVRARDYAEADRLMPHPVYGPLGWIAVVDPGDETTRLVLELLRVAHEAARRRAERRGQATS